MELFISSHHCRGGGTKTPHSGKRPSIQIASSQNQQPDSTAQVWIGVVGVGPRGAKLNSSYQNRNSQQYQEDLGLALVNFARVIPDGVLVFFPSYTALQLGIDTWKGGSSALSTWDRICAFKQPVIEPRVGLLLLCPCTEVCEGLLVAAMKQRLPLASCQSGKCS